MKFFTQETLPKTFQEYFQNYSFRAKHLRSNAEIVEKILIELRLAYAKYNQEHKKIMLMANFLKLAKGAREVKKTFVDDVKIALF